MILKTNDELPMTSIIGDYDNTNIKTHIVRCFCMTIPISESTGKTYV